MDSALRTPHSALPEEPVLLFEQVSKLYGPVIGLNQVTLELRGGITGLVGSNGAGKSTLLRLATGQLKPSLGRVTVRGVDAWEWRAKALVGYCPDNDAFYEDMGGRAFVLAMARLCGFDRTEARRRTEAVLDRVGMADRADRKLRGYSKGMRQRIKLAQALAHEPEVLVLDEPLNGLDPLARAEVIALLEDLARGGLHILLSSHVLHEVDRISDRVILMSGGYVVAEGQIQGVRGEMQSRPMQILVRCDEPARLAARVFEQDSVVEVQLHEDRKGLLVHTRDADRFYLVLNRIVLEDGIELEAVAPADDDVRSVYQYLVGHDGPSA
jgi:ABC-2 type transport system ATP-binding protein